MAKKPPETPMQHGDEARRLAADVYKKRAGSPSRIQRLAEGREFERPAFTWDSRVDQRLQNHGEWLSTLSDLVKNLQEAMQALASKADVDEVSEKMEALDASASMVKEFAERHFEFLLEAGEQRDLGQRVDRLEAELRIREDRRRQRTGNRLQVVGILVAIVLGAVGILIQVLP